MVNGKDSNNGYNLAVFNLEPTVAHIVIEDGAYKGLELFASLELTLEAYEHVLALQNDPGSHIKLVELFGEGALERWNLHRNDVPVSPDSSGMRSLPITLGLEIVGRWMEACVGVSAPLEEPSSDGAISEAALTALGDQSRSLPS